MGGSNAAAKTDWSHLRGHHVTIWPDHDKPGADYAAKVSQLAHAAGASSVRVVSAPDAWPAKWDLADKLTQDVTNEILRVMIEEACVVERENEDARFEEIENGRTKPGRPVERRAGWRRGQGSDRQWLIPANSWKEILSGHDPRRGAQVLVDAGVLIPSTKGQKQQQQINIDGANHKLYVINSAALNGAATAVATGGLCGSRVPLRVGSSYFGSVVQSVLIWRPSLMRRVKPALSKNSISGMTMWRLTFVTSR